jgi:hypothetical protein
MVASERWQLSSLPSRLPSETPDDLPLPGRRVKIQSPGQDSVAVDTAVVAGLGHGNAVSLRAVVGELAELRVVIAANPRGSARK